MRKFAATTIASLLILGGLHGCSNEATTPPPAAAAAPASETTTAAKKQPAKRRPKLEAVTKQDKSTKPFSD